MLKKKNDTKTTKTAPELSGQLADKVSVEETDTVRPVSSKDAGQLNGQARPARHKKSPPPESNEDPADLPIGNEDPFDDQITNRAVTDIAAKEGNTLLALQDAIGRKASRIAGQLAERDRRAARRRHWFWLLFIVFIIVVVLLVLPFNSHTCHWPVGIRLRVMTDILPSVCK